MMSTKYSEQMLNLTEAGFSKLYGQIKITIDSILRANSREFISI